MLVSCFALRVDRTVLHADTKVVHFPMMLSTSSHTEVTRVMVLHMVRLMQATSCRARNRLYIIVSRHALFRSGRRLLSRDILRTANTSAHTCVNMHLDRHQPSRRLALVTHGSDDRTMNKYKTAFHTTRLSVCEQYFARCLTVIDATANKIYLKRLESWKVTSGSLSTKLLYYIV
jgi:hypothetical protein